MGLEGGHVCPTLDLFRHRDREIGTDQFSQATRLDRLLKGLDLGFGSISQGLGTAEHVRQLGDRHRFERFHHRLGGLTGRDNTEAIGLDQRGLPRASVEPHRGDGVGNANKLRPIIGGAAADQDTQLETAESAVTGAHIKNQHVARLGEVNRDFHEGKLTTVRLPVATDGDGRADQRGHALDQADAVQPLILGGHAAVALAMNAAQGNCKINGCLVDLGMGEIRDVESHDMILI